MMRPIFAGLFATCVYAQSIQNLGDVAWTVSNGVNATVPGHFPSQAHLDLLAAGVIEEPTYGFNDINQLWVQRSNWTWTSEPVTGLDKTKSSKTWLVFEGLDTFAEIKMCDTTVANVANQYRAFTFDVTTILSKCAGDPILSLNFGSASKVVNEIAKIGPEYINSTNSCKGREFDGKVYMRKQQSDFGWDWSPALAPAGPWRPAYFVQKRTQDPVFIHNTLIDIYREGQMNNLSPDQNKPWVFNASIDFLGALPSDAKFQLELEGPSGKLVKKVMLQDVTRNDMTITGHTIIDEPVELWWPNGYGARPLYRATLSLVSTKWNKPATVTKRVGFRTIVLNLNPVTEEQIAAGVAPGANWHFEINGHELYVKGANFIPPDVFWARVDINEVREIFQLAVEAKQNMLRIWSSGTYLSDDIYDLADEMGLLLWSEFQFSDAEYPVTPDYLENYEAEAYYNTRRVNHHPSLALWSGGNELEAIILFYFFYPGPVLDGYEKLHTELLINCVYANTRSISYIPSSTYQGYTELNFSSARPQTPRYNNRTAPDDIYADTDVYNYDASQAFDFSKMPVGRFAAEFGFISMPSLHSWRDAISEDELSLDSRSVLHHNRHVPFGQEGDEYELSRAGLKQMTDGVEIWYPVPSFSDPVANFSAWSWATQVFQADKYANEIAHYRRGSALPERQLGSLYWQINDLWVAPTWSAVEASGRPKMMYHATKDVYNPVIVWPFYDKENDVLDVWVISDKWEAVSGEVTLRWVNWEGKELENPFKDESNSKAASKYQFRTGPINGTKIATYEHVSSAFSDDGAEDILLSLSLTTKQGDKHSSWFHAVPLGKAALRNPGLKIETKSSAHDGGVSFNVTATEAVAAWVWLDYPPSVRGYFDDNAFWLNKGESRVVQFNTWDNSTRDESWTKNVTVQSIWDLTAHE